MASIGPIGPVRVRDCAPPGHDVIPRAVWLHVVRELGHLVIATAHAGEKGTIGFRFNDDTISQVRAFLVEHSDEPWRVDPDAWKGG